jgi:dCTP deaminase
MIRPLSPFLDEKQVVGGMTFGCSAAGYDVRIAQTVALDLGGFSLASTVEHFTMPDDVLGIVHDKSTWARRGITCQNTVIEPGWRGWLTLELANHSSEPVIITEGSPIAQIVFHQLLEPTDRPYRGKYQDQPNRPVSAIAEVV